MTAWLRAAAALLVMAAAAVAGLASTWPPAARPASAPGELFSAERAMGPLAAIASRPHPTGTQAASAVRAELIDNLTRLGFEVTVQDTTSLTDRYAAWGYPVVAGHVRNVVARRPGTAGPPAGPAVRALRLARARTRSLRRRVRHGGAARDRARAAASPTRRDPAVLGGRGAGAARREGLRRGQPPVARRRRRRQRRLPRRSRRRRDVPDQRSGVGPRRDPRARRAPRERSLAVPGGVPADAERHRPHRVPARRPRRAQLRQHRRLRALPPGDRHDRQRRPADDPAAGRRDAGARAGSRGPRRLARTLHARRRLLQRGTVLRLLRRALRPAPRHPVAGRAPGGDAGSCTARARDGARCGGGGRGGRDRPAARGPRGAGGGVARFSRERGAHDADPARSGAERVSRRVPAARGRGRVVVQRSAAEADRAALPARRAALPGSALAIATAVWVPGASFTFLWPALASAAVLVGRAMLPALPARHAALVVATLAAPAVTCLVFSPMAWQLGIAFGVSAAPALAALAAVAVLPVAACVGVPATIPLRVASAALIAAALGLLAVALATPPHDAGSPKPDSLIYAIDDDHDRAWWLSVDDAPDRWTGPVLSSGVRGPLPAIFPRLPDRRFLQAPAPSVPHRGPKIAIVSDEQSGGLRRLRLHLAVTPDTEALEVLAPPTAHVSRGVVQGRAFRPASDGWLDLAYAGPPEDGLELELTSTGGPLDLTVMVQTRGLPAALAAPLGPRPADLMPEVASPLRASDMTLVAGSFRL